MGTREQLEISQPRLIVAGYTAGDEAAATRHIEELAAIGIPAPATVPAFQDLDPALLTAAETIEVNGAGTSGEVEPVIIRHDGRFFLAVGSDHTDREVERVDIAAAKAACPKPVGAAVVELGPDLAGVDWESLVARSWVDGRLYQEGPLSVLRRPADPVVGCSNSRPASRT
ncbi:DUF2848 family protein [Embleya sp. NPDC020886]|uniref:DUF2848 family protein n=1 Tax=Embleya sp. NPDC020886 TaxID=3363980 RepID=UPI00378948C8